MKRYLVVYWHDGGYMGHDTADTIKELSDFMLNAQFSDFRAFDLKINSTAAITLELADVPTTVMKKGWRLVIHD